MFVDSLVSLELCHDWSEMNQSLRRVGLVVTIQIMLLLISATNRSYKKTQKQL